MFFPSNMTSITILIIHEFVTTQFQLDFSISTLTLKFIFTLALSIANNIYKFHVVTDSLKWNVHLISCNLYGCWTFHFIYQTDCECSRASRTVQLVKKNCIALYCCITQLACVHVSVFVILCIFVIIRFSHITHKYVLIGDFNIEWKSEERTNTDTRKERHSQT